MPQTPRQHKSDDELEPDSGAEFPSEGRLLGVDYGTVRVGLAVSTPEQSLAGPIETYHRVHRDCDLEYFKAVAADYRVAGIVVGLPVHMSGDEGGKAREAREFGSWLSKGLALPVRYWDERFTSVRAEDLMLDAGLSKKKRKARVDRIAAQLMLQAYLDAADREQSPGEM